jgi:hypothetical protein
MTQVALAKELSLSPQGLSLILKGINSPNSETTLHALELLKKNSMIQTPAPNRRLSLDDDDERNGLDSAGQPRTLALAKDMLMRSQERVSFLQKEVQQLKAAPPAVAKVAKVAAPTEAPNRPATPPPTVTDSSTGMIVRPETPLTEIDRLRTQLNHASSQEEKGILYRKIKTLSAEQSGPPRRSRLRGA